MGRIYYLLGKSATGKDTLYKEILKRRPKLRTVTMYTTRPIREGETDGVEYFFTGREELERQLGLGLERRLELAQLGLRRQLGLLELG